MTRTEFDDKYRPRFLMFMTECWAFRKLPPSEFGRVVDEQIRQLDMAFGIMFSDLFPEKPLPVKAPEPPAKATTEQPAGKPHINGHASRLPPASVR